MTAPLHQQVTIVTGAGSGLGAAIARALAADGAHCVLAGRRRQPLAAVAAGLASARVVPCDVTDPAQVDHLMAETLREFGALNLLVNSAGVFQMRPFEETTRELWEATQAVNLSGPFLTCRAAWPHLKASRGQVVNVSSVAGVQGFAGSTAYCASKFGLNGLSAALALEGQPHGIRVFAVCPGNTDTPIWDGQAPPAVQRRMMRPEAVADLVRWLVAAPREVELGPVVMRPFTDPWAGP